MRRARQHGLRAQLHALLARLQDAVADLLGLGGLVAHHTTRGRHAALAVRAQTLRERALRLRGERVRGVQHAAASSGSCAPASPRACRGSARGSRGCARPTPSGSRRSPGSRRRPRSPPARGRASERARSTCRPLTSWYSSISTWSNAAASRGPITSSRASARQNSSRSSRSPTPELALARRVGLETARRSPRGAPRHHGKCSSITPDSGCCALTVRE